MLSHLEGFSLVKATEIKNKLVAPGCTRARVVTQNLVATDSDYLIMCGMGGVACSLHTLNLRYNAKSKGINKFCPENITTQKFESLIK